MRWCAIGWLRPITTVKRENVVDIDFFSIG